MKARVKLSKVSGALRYQAPTALIAMLTATVALAACPPDLPQTTDLLPSGKCPECYVPEKNQCVLRAINIVNPGSGDVKIVKGVPSHNYPAVGALLIETQPSGFSHSCTGTMIGCKTFLTAAHCVLPDPDPQNYRVFLPQAGLFEVDAIRWPKSAYIAPTTEGSKADVAIVTLKASISGINPHAINTTREAGLDPGTIVGYGRTATSAADDSSGVKREGHVLISQCKSAKFTGELVCWDFDDGTSLSPSNTCNGNSGGPLFLTNRSQTVIGGVTSGGKNANCLGDDHSYDASVFKNRTWIVETAAGLSGGEIATEDKMPQTCGSFSPLPERPGSDRVISWLEKVNAVNPEKVLRANLVGADAKRLRVSLSFLPEPGASGFGLWVIKGASADVTQAVCSDVRSSEALYCEIENPGAGDWTIVVKANSGGAEFQAAASVF